MSKWWTVVPLNSCLVFKDLASGVVCFRHYDENTRALRLYEVDLWTDEVVEHNEEEDGDEEGA